MTSPATPATPVADPAPANPASPHQPGPAIPTVDSAKRLSFTNESGERIDYEARVRLISVPRSDSDRRPVGRMSVTSFVRLFAGPEQSVSAQPNASEQVVAGQPAASDRSAESAPASAPAPAADPSRPIMVLFNGGPIVASTALLLSGIAPKRAAFNEDLDAPLRDSFRLEDSPSSLLADCDLLVMDAIGCGYGRYEPDVDVESKYSAGEDARQFAEAAAAWMVLEGRESSPLYILGESYGTVRAPLMAKAMLDLAETQISPAGVILMGNTTNIQEMHDRPRSVAAAACSLPLMAAAAWYHGKSGLDAKDWRDAVDQARAYAYGPYLNALFAGSRLPGPQRATVAHELERYTGVKASHWLRNHLAISKTRFRSLLLEDEGKVLGVYDARYAAPESPAFPVDPSSTRVTPVLAACSHLFYNDLLGVDRAIPRIEAPGDVWSAWDWSVGGPADGVVGGAKKSPFDEFDYAAPLEFCLNQIAGFRLMVANGCYDTITTVGASDALIASMNAPDGSIVQHIYPAGHMTYSDRESAIALNHDLAAFVARPFVAQA
ncbi:hypothetical protein [Bifidobacterium vespertilionis]|nr:hypothetical protein [Bifidobacterium vespertilionis]